MDDYGMVRPDFQGNLISFEFGPGGRIQQLWASNPNQPEGEEFQFVCAPFSMGDEQVEDYFPGTIMLGARTHPEDPWIVSRNSPNAQVDEREDGSVAFEYEFPFIDDLQAIGRFHEPPNSMPQVYWDIAIKNRSRRSVEIGELGFPFALNNVYEGFPRSEKGIEDLYADRVVLHPFIGGSASYLFAERLNARPPGLLIVPGEDTRWEFTHRVPASIVTPYRWSGIPIIYIHSRATIEREEWPEWFCGHTSLILEPGEERNFQFRFLPADRDGQDNVATVMQACGLPSIRLFPAAVVPTDVGIGIEVKGATPTRFYSDVEVQTETDADEEGGYCYVQATEPGAVRIGFEDTLGRISEAHVLFIEPIEELIQSRTRYICEVQRVTDPDSPYAGAILGADNTNGSPVTPIGGELVVECGIADALFVAEKNSIFPVDDELEAIDDYISRFLERWLRNPADGSVASLLPADRTTALGYGRAETYPLVTALYASMGRVAAGYGHTKRRAADYFDSARETAEACFRFAQPDGNGVAQLEYFYELATELESNGLDVESLKALLARRNTELGRRRYPFAGDTIYSTAGMAEAFAAASTRGDEEARDRITRCAYSARSLSPSWWWYGSDVAWSEAPNGPVNPGSEDKGELCFGSTAGSNSGIGIALFDRDLPRINDHVVRASLGGYLGIWSLVRSDGAASMGFCPDAASKSFGMSWFTGMVGVNLYSYLRGMRSVVMPNAQGTLVLGCHFDIQSINGVDWFVVKPWDGIGRRIALRQIGLDAKLSMGRILEMRLSSRKDHVQFKLGNSGRHKLEAVLQIRGLWGKRVTVGSETFVTVDGQVRAPITLRARSTTSVDAKVVE